MLCVPPEIMASASPRRMISVASPIAWLLARVDFRGRSLVRVLVTVPMVLPPVVGGVALLLAFGRRGLVGQWLDEVFGISLPFTTAGAALGASRAPAACRSSI